MEESHPFSSTAVDSYKPSVISDDNMVENSEKEPPYSMSGILHFLQSEWTRFEIERSQWEVERAELQARVAFLQGERKGQENLKHDLVRRIKMLEFALKQERARYHRLQFGAESSASAAAPEAPELDAVAADAAGDEELASATPGSEAASAGKDGRHLIRQYLQEIGYADVIAGVRQARAQQLAGGSGDEEAQSDRAKGRQAIEEQLASLGIGLDEDASRESHPLSEEEAAMAEFDFLVGQQDQPAGDWGMDEKTRSKVEAFRAERVRTARRASGSHDAVDGGASDDDSGRADSPPSEAAPAGPLPNVDDPELQLAVGRGAAGDDEEEEEGGFRAALGLGDLQDITVADDAGSRRTWSAKFSLRSHFDSVRAIAFHETEPALVTASEDHTLKLWNVGRPAGQQSKKGAASDLEPFHTFRGHSGAVLAACLSGDVLYSTSLDGTVRVWRVPPSTVDPYDAFDSALVGPVLAGHSDAVWGAAVTKGDADSATLFSVGADRTLRAWRPSRPEEPLLGTWPLAQQPTSVSLVAADNSKLAVSFQTGHVQLVDAETGQAVSQLSDDTAAAAGGCCNRALSHPTQRVTIAAYEDRHIRFYDNGSRALVHSMVAHLDSVTSLAVDANGLYLLSGSHDCSVRLWSLDDKTCVQEIMAHRKKFDEAIHDVALHPSRSFLASAGADGLAKVFV